MALKDKHRQFRSRREALPDRETAAASTSDGAREVDLVKLVVKAQFASDPSGIMASLLQSFPAAVRLLIVFLVGRVVSLEYAAAPSSAVKHQT